MALDMVNDYRAFIEQKRLVVCPSGWDVDPATLHPALFPFQRDITRWALRRGRAAIFADCGLGKTLMQLDWARHVAHATGGDVLILAPLAVSEQTEREGAKFGIPVTVCRHQADAQPGLNITNYEMLQHFDPHRFAGIVLDESSILKGFAGVLRKEITDFGQHMAYRLACTATPAPNDLIELTNHAEFLDIMTGKEIIALFFTQDGNSTHNWRLKGHAKDDFWRWMASWCVAVRKPSDLGYPDDGFVLPPLRLHQVTVDGAAPTLTLFPVEALTILERRQARRSTIDARVAVCAELVNASGEPWVAWCDLNAESGALAKAIPDAVEVRGSDTPEHKKRALVDFSTGRIRVIVTKPSIAGFGLNWQHCSHMAFVGLSDSYEQLYQATRRCWRFGQKSPVNVHIITAETEGAVVKNIHRKEKQAEEMMDSVVRHMAGLSLGHAGRDEMEYQEDSATGTGWQMRLGDSILVLDNLEAESVGLILFSPPFPGMYVYTNSVHDIGNAQNVAEMLDQYRFMIPKLLRVAMPGRMCCVHLSQTMAHKSREGYIGIHDYRGAIIAAMESGGWIYAGEVTIDKNPQAKASRTKEMGLLYKTLSTDSTMCRMALADYLIYFRKPGVNPRPVNSGKVERYNGADGWITEDEWNEWAAPVWYRKTAWNPGGIQETDVLNVAQARETDDERHLCPLQLGVIERAVKLWSAPGELILDPFAGIGSTGYQALLFGRRFLGIELKRSYFQSAIRNLRVAASRSGERTLFDGMEQPT